MELHYISRILCAGKSRRPWLPFPWKDQQLRDHHPEAAATGKERLRVHERGYRSGGHPETGETAIQI